MVSRRTADQSRSPRALRTQDLPPVYEENSCLYLFSRDDLVHRGSRIGDRPMLFEIDPVEAADIDVEIDFIAAEAIHRRMVHA